jgi:hypothetical protein
MIFLPSSSAAENTRETQTPRLQFVATPKSAAFAGILTMVGMLSVQAWLSLHTLDSETRMLAVLAAAGAFVLLPALVLVVGLPRRTARPVGPAVSRHKSPGPGAWFRIVCWVITSGVFGIAYAAFLNALLTPYVHAM